MSAFSENLRRLRKERNLSQEQLANYLGLSKSSVNMYERGEREPNFETIEAIADLFNVNFDFLLGRESFSYKTGSFGGNNVPTKKPQFSMVMDESLLKAVEDYQIDHRIKSRTKAINELIEAGIKAVLKEDTQAKNSAEPNKADPVESKSIENPVEALTKVLCRAGLINSQGDISDADLAFLEASFLLFKAHFDRPKKGGE